MGVKKEDKIYRVIIHNPNQWLLNQFCHNSIKRKIVWNRNNNNPSVIALNEWPRVKILKTIIGLPFVAFVLLSIIPTLLLLTLMHFVNKGKSELIQQEYFNLLNWLAKNKSSDYSNAFFDLEMSFRNTPKYAGLLRVLYVEKGSEEILLKIDCKRIRNFVDEIWINDSIEKVISKIVREEYLLNHCFTQHRFKRI